jgi:glycosyltransferase involved in cell wall biosynthesis
MLNILTICIPTRDRPEMLAEAIKSALRVFGPSIEILIGDNGDEILTAKLLKNLEAEYPEAVFRHIKNPTGSTYVYNLQTLIDNVQTPWLSIMHDDDLYDEISIGLLENLFSDKTISFIFSDHWVMSADGTRLYNETEDSSRNYGRLVLKEGKIAHLGELAVNQVIGLDGFYVRSVLAKSSRFNLKFKVFGDSQWLISLASKADAAGYYIKKRTFSYRLNPSSLTSVGFDQIEMHDALSAACVFDEWTGRALNARLKKNVWVVLRYSFRNARLGGLLSAMFTLIGRFPRKKM